MKTRTSPSEHWPETSSRAGVRGLVPDRRVARLGQIFEGDGESLAGRFEDLARFQIIGQQPGFQRRRHDHNFEIGPRVLLNLQGAGERHIAFQMPLVKFVEDKDANAGKLGITLHLPQQNALGDVENARIRSGYVLKPVLEAYLAAEHGVSFLRHAAGEEPGGDPAGLEDDDAALVGEAVVEQILRDLGRLARSSRRLDDDAARGAESAPQIGAQGGNGKQGHE
jgi:hypothetical protein